MTTSTQQTNSSNQQQNFWAPQAPYITGVMSDAQNAYNTAQGAPAPSNFVAGLTPDQINTFNSMVSAGNGNTTGATLTGAGTNAVGTGTGALSSAASGYGNFNPAASNNMNANIAGANQYVNGVNIPAQVANAMQGAVETARDVTLPGIQSAAAANGNINSSRTGIADGLVERGLAEEAGNLAGTLSNQAYATGANLASNTNTVNNAATLSALSGLSGLGTGALTAGTSAINSGNSATAGALGLSEEGGAGLQGGNQANLNNQMAQWQFGTQAPFAALSQYAPFVTTPYGSSGTSQSTTTSTPSFLQTLGQVLGAGSSLMGGIFGGNGLLGANGAFGNNGALKFFNPFAPG